MIDWKYPLELDGGDIKIADNRDLAIATVLSPIQTQIGERLMQPDYGGLVYLFEPGEQELRFDIEYLDI